MSAAIKLKATAGGSVSLQADDTLTTDEVMKFFNNNATGVTLTGAELTAVGIIGTSPEATLYPDGSIVGSSSNGSFTKWANGDVYMSSARSLSITVTEYASLTWVYPLVFATTTGASYTSIPTAALNVTGPEWLSYAAGRYPTVGSSTYSFRDGAGITRTGSLPVNISAKGRWK